MPVRAVRLNVYYLTPSRSIQSVFNAVSLGIFTPYHSAVEIDGTEYAFYGHPFDFSGVMSHQPNRGLLPLAYSKIYGHSSLPSDEIESQAHSLTFTGIRYDLLTYNCNTFTDAFLYALTERHLPPWVNRAERVLRRLLCLRRLFEGNEDISTRIVSALYVQSAGDQTTVFDLLGIGRPSEVVRSTERAADCQPSSRSTLDQNLCHCTSGRCRS